MDPKQLAEFLAGAEPVVRVELTRVRGSTPREAGAFMLVSAGAMIGTIGGGQLEYMARDAARALLRRGETHDTLDLALGPAIGQCCGGRVELSLDRLDAAARADLQRACDAEFATLPQVLVFGAGHVGRALADLFQHLPVHAVLIDTRAEELDLVTARVETRLTPLPEAELRRAPAGSAFVVLTHDHALDFLLATEALARGDAAYVGMIGSATKRARFERQCRQGSDRISPADIVCPIGAGASDDKRPAVIAALVVAEVITALTGRGRTGTAPNEPPESKAEMLHARGRTRISMTTDTTGDCET